MNFLKQLFNVNEDKQENATLIGLIKKWEDNPSPENYSKVAMELIKGEPILYLPSLRPEKNADGSWKNATAETLSRLRCVFNIDGREVLVAFTDEERLLQWAPAGSGYLAMNSADLLSFCTDNNIFRIVINTGQKNMFFIDREPNIRKEKINSPVKVKVGLPSNPLRQEILKKISVEFEKNPNVMEGYHYLMTKNDRESYVIGIKLLKYSFDDQREASLAVGRSLQGEEYLLPVNIFFWKTMTGMNV